MIKTLEELGYEKKEEEFQIIYENADGDKIIFITLTESVCVMDCYESYQFATMDELKAINAKCEEFGWLDE